MWLCARCGKIVPRNREAYFKYVIDYTDAYGKRHLETCPKNWTAKRVKERAADLEKEPGGDPHILFGEVVEQWLERCRAQVKAKKLRFQSLRDYERKIRHLSALNPLQIASIRRGMILELLTKKLNEGLSSRTVSEIRGRLHGIFQFAIALEYTTVNPMAMLTKDLELEKASTTETVRAMNRRQRDMFLETAEGHDPEVHPFLFTLSRTGMRINEAAALMPEDLDLEQRKLHVERTWVESDIQEELKSKYGERDIDLSMQACELLARLLTERKRQRLAMGWAEMPQWLFVNKYGRRWRQNTVSYRVKQILEKAKLPSHFSAHSLRHTYARLHLEAGTRLEYIQRQMGHATIAITNELYGRWAKISDPSAADRLDSGFAEMQRKLDLS